MYMYRIIRKTVIQRHEITKQSNDTVWYFNGERHTQERKTSKSIIWLNSIDEVKGILVDRINSDLRALEDKIKTSATNKRAIVKQLNDGDLASSFILLK